MKDILPFLKKLHVAHRAVVSASVADSWKGAQHPDDQDAIEYRLTSANNGWTKALNEIQEAFKQETPQ